MSNSAPPSHGDDPQGFRILAAVEDPPEEVVTLRRAQTWHRALPGPLEILRVVSEDSKDPGARERILDALQTLASAAGADHDALCLLETGKAADVIRERATRPACDLLVLGRSAKPSLSDRWFGGVAESLLDRPPCPVLLPGNRSGIDDDDGNPHRILLLSDGSEVSRSVFPLAARIVEAFGASLIVVHVCHPESLPGEREYERHGPSIEALRRERRDSFSRWLDENQKPLPSRREIRLLEGVPSETACRHAATVHADLIILATRGHSGWLGLTGGTAIRVARDSPCSVLLVPPALPAD